MTPLTVTPYHDHCAVCIRTAKPRTPYATQTRPNFFANFSIFSSLSSRACGLFAQYAVT